MARAIELGELITLLKHRPQDDQVRFDFGGFIPRYVASYRGFYEQLAIGYDEDWQKPVTVAELLIQLRGAVGATFTGYKGGEYTMDASTPVWAANHGYSNQTAIVGLADCSWQTVLATAFVDS
jgi:hypothetical protein